MTSAAPEFVLYTRAGCHLCEILAAELRALAPGARLTAVDVDRDPTLARRYGFDVPVLLADGEELCRHRLDAGAVTGWLRAKADGIPGGSRS